MAFHQSPPQLDNQYTHDGMLTAFLRRTLPADVLREHDAALTDMGARAAGDLLTLARAHRLAEPVHTPWDAWGNRIDQVTVSTAWEEFRGVAARAGLVALPYEGRHGEYARVLQFALVYLFDRSTQVYTCPLAMTDGCARTLSRLADPTLRARVLPRLISRDPARAWTSGQWMTERTGGSDVGLTQTVARRIDGGWQLFGDKWFTSAVTADVALTLARPEGQGPGGKNLALFFVTLRDAQGRLQNITVNRLKEKLGTRLLPTAELSLHGTPALPVAGLGDGIKNMASMLNITRTWNSVCSVASMRRGLALAQDYAKRRHAFGTALADNPLHVTTLADMAADTLATFLLVFHGVHLLGRDEAGTATGDERQMLGLLQPLMKLYSARRAVAAASEALESFGGAGYIEDTGLPELLRDAQVLSIWEGTTNVLAMEVLRAIRRDDALAPFIAAVRRHAAAGRAAPLITAAAVARDGCDKAAQWLATHAESGAGDVSITAGARHFAFALARALGLALLIEHAQWLLDTHQDASGVEAASRYSGGDGRDGRDGWDGGLAAATAYSATTRRLALGG